MKDSLKEALEELVREHVGVLEICEPVIKRIVLFSPGEFNGEVTEILNCTENYLLSTQFKIDHREIRVVVIPKYNSQRDFQEGDYTINVGAYLRSNPPKSS